MRKQELKELARDFIAIGSLPFLILVLIRISIIKNPVYFLQIIFSATFFLIIKYTWRKKINIYSGLGIIMLFFTSLYYKELIYTIFASIVYIGLILSLIYLQKHKNVIKSISIGILSIIFGYVFTYLIF